jgi:hypothetical protein
MQSPRGRGGYQEHQVTNQGWKMLMRPMLLGFAIGFLAFAWML